MKYVFYDSESIDIKHKYSFTFGYLVTDDKFNIINRCEDIVFNPDAPNEELDMLPRIDVEYLKDNKHKR